jgi:hypothetical protein
MRKCRRIAQAGMSVKCAKKIDGIVHFPEDAPDLTAHHA